MDLSKYKNILGVPGQGPHSYRIFNIAIVDVLLTFVAAYLISFLFRISFFWTTIFLFILGIFLHRIFSVRTTLDKFIFPKL